MATFSDLQAQAQALLAQAKEMRAAALAQILQTMREHQLTLDDLEPGTTKRASAARRRVGEASSSRPRMSDPPRYFKSPNGEIWRWRPGRRPPWLQEALMQGKRFEDFEVPAPPLQTLAAAAPP